MLGHSHPKVAAMLTDAQPDLLAFAAFPRRHWRQIWATNPLERVNKEIKRRTDVVGVFLVRARGRGAGHFIGPTDRSSCKRDRGRRGDAG